MTQDKTVTLDTSTLAELLREAATPRPPTPQQIAAQTARALAEGRDSLYRTAEERRETMGLPRPAPGDKLIVRCAKVAGRRRAGIDFSTHPTTLEVTSLPTDEAKASRPENGEGPISVAEATLILSDDALAVSVIAARFDADAPGPSYHATRETELREWEESLLERAKALSAREAELAKGAKTLPVPASSPGGPTGHNVIERPEGTPTELKSDRSFDTGESTPAVQAARDTVVEKPKADEKPAKPDHKGKHDDKAKG